MSALCSILSVPDLLCLVIVMDALFGDSAHPFSTQMNICLVCARSAKITSQNASTMAINKVFSVLWKAACRLAGMPPLRKKLEAMTALRAMAKARNCTRQTKVEGGARPRAKAETEADHQGGMLHE